MDINTLPKQIIYIVRQRKTLVKKKRTQALGAFTLNMHTILGNGNIQIGVG